LTPSEADDLREVLYESPVFSSRLSVEGRKLLIELRHPFGNWGSKDEVDSAVRTWAGQLQSRVAEFLSSDVVTETSVLLQRFKRFVERQGKRDLWIDGHAREQAARGVLQAYLDSRSYQEVPTSAGRSDLLIVTSRGTRLLLETKIWRGPRAFRRGIEQLRLYLIAENDDKEVAAAFYIIFDPTRNHQAEYYLALYWERVFKKELAEAGILPVIINIDRNLPSAPNPTPAADGQGRH